MVKKVIPFILVLTIILSTGLIFSVGCNREKEVKYTGETYGLGAYLGLDELAKLRPDVFFEQQSSYDRDGGNVDGFGMVLPDGKNESGEADGDSVIKRVLLNLQSPGVVYRMFFTNFGDVPNLRIYIDGKKTVDMSLADLTSGKNYPFVYPFVQNKTQSSGGFVCYLPIAFAESIEIIGSGNFYCSISYHVYPADVKIQPFTMDIDLADATKILTSLGSDPKYKADNQTKEEKFTLNSNAKKTLEINGKRSVSSISLKIPSVTAVQYDRRVYASDGIRLSAGEKAYFDIEAEGGAILKHYKNVKYQVFHNAIIYQSELDEAATCIKGDAYVEWMQGYETVEDALYGHKIAFDLKPDVEYSVESGTYKAATFDKTADQVTITYDDKSFVLSESLYIAWMGEVETFAQASAINGVPVYACEDYLVTTKYYFGMKDGNAIQLNSLGSFDLDEEGKIFGDVTYSENVKKIVTDAFADAYLFAYTRNDHLLGQPVGDTQALSFVDSASAEPVHYIAQQFENGVIIQSGYNSPAVAIYGNVLEAVEALGGYEVVGLPIARQYTHEGITYCNFTFGYLKVPAEGAPSIVYNAAVGTKGNEIDRNIGRFESRANVKKGHIDFEHELLRIYEAYVAEYERITDTGFRLYTGAVALGHEWNAHGISQSFIAGGSTSTAWGQQKLSVMIMNSPYEKAYVVRNIILDFYAAKGGNNLSGNFGMPTSDDFTAVVTCVDEDGTEVEITVTFQNFGNGVIYSYVNTIDEIYVSAVPNGVATADGKVTVNGQEVVLDIEIGKELPPLPPEDSSTPQQPSDSSVEEKGCKSSFGVESLLLCGFLFVSATIINSKKRKNR